MLKAGLVSISFRSLSRKEIGAFITDSGLTVVEWGSDVHVPAADSAAVKEVLDICSANGIEIGAYGSYYYPFLGNEHERAYIRAHVACAVTLGAPTIRIWAGKKGSAVITPEERATVVREIRYACELAAESGITVSLECHNNTLTDDCDSALRLIDEVAHPALRLYWQPNQFRDDAYNLETLKRELPYVTNVHVFSWNEREKLPLIDHEHLWRQYIDCIANSGRDHGLLLEFACDDTTDQLKKDAEVLRGWLEL